MMRLTGGEARGRLLQAPPPPARPTQDRVRAALFSALATRVAGARVLDLFAGSGALGLEAWSRGAAAVTWVESSPAAFRVLRANLAALKVPPADFRAIRSDVFPFLARPPAVPYDWVLADPPYELARKEHWLLRISELLLENRWLAPGAVWVFETDDPAPPLALPAPLAGPLFDRSYGTTRLLLWQHRP